MTLGGITIADPTTFEQEWYKITKSGRTASGKMTMEIVSRKRKFNLTWSVITGSDLDVILDLIDADTAFYAFTYPERDGTTGSATVYTGAIKGVFYRNAGTRLFTDVSVALIEQ